VETIVAQANELAPDNSSRVTRQIRKPPFPARRRALTFQIAEPVRKINEPGTTFSGQCFDPSLENPLAMSLRLATIALQPVAAKNFIS
jgi:hypothetical protein